MGTLYMQIHPVTVREGPAEDTSFNMVCCLQLLVQLKARMLNQKFNAKPYNGLTPGATVSI
jgi:hypothetical protein